MTARSIAALLVLVPALSIRADDKPGPLPPELNWIPPNSVGFVHVRFAELWDSAAGKALRDAFAKSDPQAIPQIESKLGLQLSQIDRLTILLPDLLDDDAGESFVLRVFTTEPYDAKRLLAALDLEEERRDLTSRRFHKLRFSNAGLHLTGPKELTFLFGRGSLIGLLVRLLERETAGTLTPALNLAAQKNHIVAGIDLKQLRDAVGENAPPSARILLNAKTAVVRGNLKADSVDFDLRMNFARGGHAEDGVQALEHMRKEVIAELERTVKEFSGDKDSAGAAKVFSAVLAMVKSAKVEVAGADVVGTMSFKTGGPLEAIAAEAVAALKGAAGRTESQNNLKQIGLALHNYHDTNGAMPPAAICDAAGKPLLSWRVAILPYIEADNLYKEFKLDEPWDSEHNKKLIARMPKTFALPGDKVKHELPSTYYRVFYGNDAFFDHKKGVGFARITDGLSNTLMVVEAADAVPWTKPDELEYDPKKPPKLGFHFRDRGNVLFGDGSVRALPKTIKESTLHLLIQRSDGMVINIPD